MTLVINCAKQAGCLIILFKLPVAIAVGGECPSYNVITDTHWYAV